MNKNMSKTTSSLVSQSVMKTVLVGGSLLALLASSGCATSSLLDDNRVTTTSAVKTVLSQDRSDYCLWTTCYHLTANANGKYGDCW